MSNAGELGAVLYEAETNWGEDVTTFATHRLPVLGPIDLSGITHPKIDSQRLNQYLQGGTQHILGPQDATFKMRLHLTGHGVAPTGSLTTDAMETFLGTFVFGKLTQSASASTTLTGGTAAAPTTTASGTFAAGALAAIGALGDGDGNGQVFAIGTHATTTLNLLTELDGAPVNGAVLYSGVNMYLPESATDAAATVPSFRLLCMTANLKVELHGCFVQSWTIGGTMTGETLFIELDVRASWWRYSTAGTFPSTVTSNQYNPAPNAAGSFFLNAVGTATRAKRVYRSMSIGVTVGVAPLMGPGGVNQYQTIVGAKRVPSMVKVNWTEDADSVTASPALDGFFTGTTAYHGLLTLNAIPGTRVAFYFPNLCFTGPRPMQTASDRINRLPIEATAYTGGTATTELTLSAMRCYFG